MAQCFRYVCDNCGKSVESWSDGNPYFINEQGQKQYAYHPNQDNLAKCIGNDITYFCLNCGEEFEVDSLFPDIHCLQCKSTEIIETDELDKQQCPLCRKGRFEIDKEFFAIS